MAETLTIVDDGNIQQIVQSQQVRMRSFDAQLEQGSADLSKLGERITDHRKALSAEITTAAKEVRRVSDGQIAMRATLDQINLQLGRKSGNGKNGRVSRRDGAMLGVGGGVIGVIEAFRLFLLGG